MIKRSKWVYIVGSVIIGIVSVLFIFSGLIFSGVIDASSRKLVFSSAGTYKTYDGEVLQADKWELSSGKLKEGHKAQVKVFGKQTDVGKSENEFSVVILDANGADVTSDYKIERQMGILEVKPFDLTVSADDVERVYNGKPLTGKDAEGDGYSLDRELPADHEIKVSFVGSLTNAGTKDNTPSVSIFHEEREVTSNFNIQALKGTLTVKPMDLIIKSFDAKKVYDGKPCESADGVEYEILSGKMVGDDEIEVILLNKPVDAGEYKNEFSVNILNGEKSNYKIDYKYGKLEIEKFKITLKTESKEWDYDGSLHSHKEFSFSPSVLPEGEFVVDKNSFKGVKNVLDSCDNEVAYELKGVSPTNYEVVPEFGKLTIKPLQVTVTTSDLSWVYDGAKHRMEKNSENEHNVSFFCANPVSGETFQWEADTSAVVQNVTDEDVLNSVFCSVQNGDESNYEFEKNFGKLSILRRAITIETESKSYEYDGKAHPTAEERGLIVADCSNLDGTDLVFQYQFEDFSSIVNVLDSGVKIPLEWNITYGGSLVSLNNFDVTEAWGEVKIEKRLVKFRTPDSEKFYDGSPLTTADEADLIEGSLVGGHSLTIDCTGSMTFVVIEDGEFVSKANTYQNADITDGTGSVLDNYDLEIECGELLIRPRPIDICVSNYTGVYDGFEHSVDDPVCEGLPVDVLHTFYLSAEYEPYRVMNVSDSGSYSLIDIGSVDEMWYVERTYEGITEIVALDNFDVTYVDGYISIRPYLLSITTRAYTTYYTGEEQMPTDDCFSIDRDQLDSMNPFHEFSPVFIAHKDAGQYWVELDLEKCEVYNYSNNGEDNVIDNYDVEVVESGEFIINKRPIYIRTSDSRTADDQSYFVYDGTEKEYPHYDNIEGLLENHEFEDLEYTKARNCTKDVDGNYIGVANEISNYDIKNENGESVKDNYELVPTYGRLVVLPVEFTLATESYTTTYDGKEWTYEKKLDFTETKIEELQNQYNVLFTFEDWAKAKNVQMGGIDNSCSFKVLKDGEDITQNFKANEEFGTLTVLPKEVYIFAPSETRQYNGEAWTGGNLDFGEEQYETGVLYNTHEFTYQLYVPTITTVGKADYEIMHEKITDMETGEDITSNYVITCNSYREITKRSITVVSANATKTYDGTKLEKHTVNLGFNKLLDGHTYLVEFSGSQTEIGISDNVFTITDIVDENGVSVAHLYEVTTVYGRLTVTAP